MLGYHQQFDSVNDKHTDEHSSFHKTPNNQLSVLSSHQRQEEGEGVGEFKSPGSDSERNGRNYNLGYVINLTLISAIGGFLFG